ncbi:MAG: hypothetical protein IE909_12325, partial [Campylobacterales bacterium]|nr:hypothetical protein [Campylobacterales bacterium]
MFLFAKKDVGTLKLRYFDLEEELSNEMRIKNEILTSLNKRNDEFFELEKSNAVLRARFEENINSYEEKLKLLEDAKNQMKLEFSALAN